MILSLAVTLSLTGTVLCDAIAPEIPSDVSSEIKGILPFVIVAVIAITLVIARKLHDRK